MAVVKANAYGYGALEIAETSIKAGATWLGVATLDEALVLRMKLSRFVPILVLGYVGPEHLSIVSRNRITVTAISLQWIQAAAEAAKESFDFHLKLDTGMNRLGCKTIDEVRSVAKIVSYNPYLNWTGAFTHFATSNNMQDQSYYYRQLALFLKFLKFIPQRNDKIIHCANSGVTLYHSEKPFFDMVRIGRALTGPPVDSLQHLQPFPLERSTITLHSTLVLVKLLNAGEKVGYDETYTTKKKEWIGTVPIGYADGWRQQFKTNGVLVDGKRVPIVGKIAMDQLMVALAQKYPVGTRVTFIGQQGNDTILVDEIERTAKVARLEIFPAFSSRIPRIYTQDGSITSIRNALLDSVILS